VAKEREDTLMCSSKVVTTGCLLDVVGKLFARILQGRLQKLAEDEVPELLCVFSKG